MSFLSVELSDNWRWKQHDPQHPVSDELALKEGWTPAHSMPSDIYVELIHTGKIPHPYKGWNEHKVQWVADKEWLYSTTFAHEANGEHTDLVFEGLDTYCDIYLNGKEILKADNMFRPWRVSLSADQLKGSNELLLHFKSTREIALALEKQLGKQRAGSVNLGHPSRVYVRKAQYHFRWDWGPELMSVGPWLPVRLETYSTRIATVNTHAFVSSSLDTSLKVDLGLAGTLGEAVQVAVSVSGAQGVIKSVKKSVQSADALRDVAAFEFSEGEVELWWPVGHGKQPLYTVDVVLSTADGKELDKQTKRIGFRRVELVQESMEDQPGTTFLFEINNVRIFIGGSCWVPIDNMLTTATPERYRAWLQLMVDGNQNMVRIWGGGIYESDSFYDTCDELGLLVWQDFMFACGVYPIHDEFLASVKSEAELAVERIRHHPSLVLLCGNNEDYQQVMQWGVSELPAVKIYEDILPKVVSTLTDPEIPYHRGSPWGGKGWDTADPTVGDIHQWDVWAGKALFYQDWDILGGRFVSEFGLPAFPHMQTIDYFFEGEDAKHRYPQSKLIAQHNKAGAFERKFAIYMNENFRMTDDLETYCYLTRLMQGEGVGAAYRHWRHDWKGPGKQYNGGALVWQINDSWPVTSWATVDYFLRPKPAYYATKREMQPYTVGIKRTVKKNKENDRPRQFYEFGAFQSMSAELEIWGTNSTLAPREFICEIWYYDLESTWKQRDLQNTTLLPNQSTHISIGPCAHPKQPAADPNGDPLPTPTYSIVACARLLDFDTKRCISRYIDWPQPYKFLEVPEPGLKIEVDGDKVVVRTTRPVKGLVLDVEGDTDSVKWSDNAIDVIPGDLQRIEAKGLNGRPLTVAHLGKERATPYKAP